MEGSVRETDRRCVDVISRARCARKTLKREAGAVCGSVRTVHTARTWRDKDSVGAQSRSG